MINVIVCLLVHLQLKKMEEYEFCWEIDVITNKNNRKTLILKKEDKCVDDARRNIITDIMRLSRYGMPCYIFDSRTKKYYLVFFEPKYKASEYYIITLDFIQCLSSTPKEIHSKYKTPHLNAFAKPFVPYTTPLNYGAKPFVPCGIH